MEALKKYSAALEEALNARREWLVGTEIPLLKDELRTYYSYFKKIYEILLKRGALIEDPYKQEIKDGELKIPPVESFPESRMIDELSLRLSLYDSQLDYLVNFYPMNLEDLTQDTVKLLTGLVNFIDWPNLASSNSKPNTRALAEIITSVKGSLDQISLSLLGDFQTDIGRITAKILSQLNNITEYQKELLKNEIRRKITMELVPEQPPGESLSDKKRAEYFAEIRGLYRTVIQDAPFYPAMIEEILKEDYTVVGGELKKQILKDLTVPETKPKTPKAADHKQVIIDGFRALSGVSASLEEIITKFDENNHIMENAKDNVWERIKRLFRHIFKVSADSVVYNLVIFDPIQGTSVKETVNYAEYRAELDRRVHAIAALGRERRSELEKMGEDQLLLFLDKSIKEVQGMHRKLASFDDFFKSNSSRNVRERIRGIKPELSAIKNAVLTAGQRRYEFIMLKDQAERLKRMGIQQ
jgi:hypothetical protein